MDLHLEQDLTDIIQMQDDFGKHSPVVRGYCQLFVISPLKLKATKFRILLREMKRLFEAETFSYQKKIYKISRTGIAEALDIMVKRNFEMPLTNHNYLKACMMTIAEREAQEAGRQTEKVLRQKEEKLMVGEREPSTDEVERNKKRLKSLIETIG